MCDDLGGDYSEDIDTDVGGNFSDDIADDVPNDIPDDILEDDYSNSDDFSNDLENNIPDDVIEDNYSDGDDFSDDLEDGIPDDIPEDDYYDGDALADDAVDEMEDVSDDVQSDEIEMLDFDNSDMLSNSETEDFTEENSDFNEALIDTSVNDVPVGDTNYEDAGEISLSDLENPDNIDEELSTDDILTTNDFDSPVSDNTYVDGDIEPEDGGPVKVLKRDPDELISVGNDLVNDRLEVLEDQYRDDGLSEEEIQNRLANDKLETQQEFLNDAFPEQGVSTDVFNRFDNQIDLAANESIDISNINDMDNWLGDINPNFDEFDTDSPYCNNCGSCAYAVWKRLEGDNDICASAENIGYNDEMEALTGMQQVSMSPDDIESNLLAQGDGAHAIIGIDRAEGPGHWFNAACIDGKVVAIDGQSGEILDWPPDYGDVVNWEMGVKKG